MKPKIEYSNFISTEYSKKLADKYGYRDWMISRFLNFIPNTEILLDYIDKIITNKSLDFEYIRSNDLKINPIKLKEVLTQKGYIVKDTILKEVFQIERTKQSDGSKTNLPSIGSTIEYLKGYYYIQDLSSCLAVDELELDESDASLVLDMAASPGGKTTFIAQRMKNNGNIIACESNLDRIPSLMFNLSRCGVTNTSIFNLPGENIEQLGLKFDRILLDAPCSCEGIIIKDKTRKKSRSLNDIHVCSLKQKKLIYSAIDVLKSNGIMIYCTCSFAPEENEMVINDILTNYKESSIEVVPIKYGVDGLTEYDGHRFEKQLSETKRLYPHIHNTSGFYIAKLRKI